MKTLSIHVRRANHDDIPALAEAHVASIREIGPAFYTQDVINIWGKDRDIEKYYVDMDEMGGIYFIAETHSRPGYVLGFAVYAFREEKHNLQALYVRGTEARKGIGRKLADAVENFARTSGAQEIHLEASLSAEDFYKAYGFTEISRCAHPLDKEGRVSMDAILMKKILYS